MKKDGKGKMRLVPPQIVARLTITAFAGQPPKLDTSTDLAGSLHLLGAGLTLLGNAVAQMDRAEATDKPIEEKKRKFLGVRGEPKTY